MKKQTYRKLNAVCLAVLIILVASFSVFAQTDATRRLLVAVVGY